MRESSPLLCRCHVPTHALRLPRRQAEAQAAQEAALVDDSRRLKQHVREQEASTEELLKQFWWAAGWCWGSQGEGCWI